MVFFLTMALNPEVQKRAQKEIDEIVGFERLPDFNDRPQLVYVDALLREIMRWQQSLPIGTADRSLYRI
jgi:cytochrome P450